ncbi:hypothetical protein [Kitasatospora sp. NBC_01539]|uniref:hypothetical protein n=1 Tax=unclassified Kitasatospora TaxID=2633591 RepID=UPI0034DC071D
MGSYVITIPGTLHRPLDDGARRSLVAGLRGVDPEQVGAEVPDLDVLTVGEPEGTFVLRLEVEAADRTAAGDEALRLARDAFAAVGFTGDDVATGRPAITGIDVG